MPATCAGMASANSLITMPPRLCPSSNGASSHCEQAAQVQHHLTPLMHWRPIKVPQHQVLAWV
jgi:hypothetical protein